METRDQCSHTQNIITDIEYTSYKTGLRHALEKQMHNTYLTRNNNDLAYITTLQCIPLEYELKWIERYIREELKDENISFFHFKNFVAFQFNTSIHSHIPKLLQNMEIYLNCKSNMNTIFVGFDITEINLKPVNISKYSDIDAWMDKTEHTNEEDFYPYNIHPYADAIRVYFSELKPYLISKFYKFRDDHFKNETDIITDIVLDEVSVYKYMPPKKIRLLLTIQWEKKFNNIEGTPIIT